MKKLFIFTILVLNLILTPLFGQSTQNQTKTQPAPKIDYKEAFLQFALDKAKTYSGKLEDIVSKGVDEAQKEAPELAKEYIRYKFWYSLIAGITPFIAAILCVWLFMSQWPKWSFDAHLDFDKGSALNLIGTLIGAGGSITFSTIWFTQGLFNLLNCLEIAIAPRVYIVDQVLHLIRK